MNTTPEEHDLVTRGGTVGSRVGLVIALVTGSVLTTIALSNPALAFSIVLATAGVSAAAHRIGRIAGAQIASRSAGAAFVIGMAGGAASLVVAGVLAAGIGAVWSLGDTQSLLSSETAWSYVGKPFLAVLTYGGVVAVALGATGGLIIWLWLRRGR